MDSVEQLADRWQEMMTCQDQFIADVLNKHQQIHRKLASNSPSTNDGSDTSYCLDRVTALQDELDRAREEMARLEKERDEFAHQNQLLEVRTFLAERRTPPLAPATPQRESPPWALVLIDGSACPFSKNWYSQGQTGADVIKKRLRHEVQQNLAKLNGGQEVPVSCVIFYHKTELVARLLKLRLLGSPSTFDEFTNQFNADPIMSFVDLGPSSSSVEAKLSGILQLHAAERALKRIFVAGMHPTALLRALPELGSPVGTPLSRELLEKVVLVNARESEADAIELGIFGSHVVTWDFLFGTDAGLGLSWGAEEGTSSVAGWQSGSNSSSGAVDWEEPRPKANGNKWGKYKTSPRGRK